MYTLYNIKDLYWNKAWNCYFGKTGRGEYRTGIDFVDNDFYFGGPE